jgi:hypothetical protein
VIGWIGALKYANVEAHQIQPLVAHSPFMGWLYHVFPVHPFSAVLGVFESRCSVCRSGHSPTPFAPPGSAPPSPNKQEGNPRPPVV